MPSKPIQKWPMIWIHELRMSPSQRVKIRNLPTPNTKHAQLVSSSFLPPFRRRALFEPVSGRANWTFAFLSLSQILNLLLSEWASVRISLPSHFTPPTTKTAARTGEEGVALFIGAIDTSLQKHRKKKNTFKDQNLVHTELIWVRILPMMQCHARGLKSEVCFLKRS